MHTPMISYIRKEYNQQQMHTPMISYIRKEYINNKCTHQWYLILEKNTSTTNAHTNDILY